MTERKPQVTAIIVVKDGEKHIARATRSVLEQEYPASEIVVVDGHSADRTIEIARSFDDVHVIQQVNEGIADAYNLGIQSAAGEIVSFLSSDDTWTADKLRRQVSCLLNEPKLLFTTARVKFILQDESYIPPGFREELLAGDHVAHIMETLVAWKEVFEKVGYFNTSLAVGEDVDWFARAFDAKIPMRTVQHVLLQKYIHNRNLSLNTPDSNRYLLRSLRESIRRKRAAEQSRCEP